MSDDADGGHPAGSIGRRAAGAAVVVLSMAPLYGLAPDGPGGGDIVRAADGRLVLAWAGTATALLLAAALAWWLPEGVRVPARFRASVREAVSRAAGSRAAEAALAAAGALAAVAVSLGPLDAGPALLDTAVQLVHAGFLAAGRMAGPALELPEFRAVQFMIETGRGWVSQYPPGQVGLLAAGLAAGAPWAVGPAAHGLTVWWTARAGELAFGGRRRALVAAAVVAGSPFLLALAGAGLSHAPAGAAAAATAWLAIAAGRDGSTARAIAAGAAAGALFTIRPYSGVVLGGGLLIAGLWAGRARAGGTSGAADAGWWARRLAGAAAGAAPFLVLVALYNAHFFGHPLRFGYLAAAGPSAGLGFHVDPWGVAYGPLRALGLTSADLVSIGVDMLRTPVPVTVVAGGYLLVARRLGPGARVAALWALAPVAANVLYWHHDLVLGPRMLGEAGPGWALLLAASLPALAARLPRAPDWPGSPRPRRAAAAVGVAVLAAALVLGPVWLGSHADRADPAPPPEARAADGGVVFVHESWPDRLGARLSARGLRMDSVRSLLRRHPPCRLEGMLVLGEAPETAREELVRRCRRQDRADRLGSLGLATFLWRGDLPGVERDGPAYVRDLGPERNRDFLRAHPDRRPAGVLLPGRDGEQVRLVPYGAAMDTLWAGSDDG